MIDINIVDICYIFLLLLSAFSCLRVKLLFAKQIT
jgi:hypothetical protein